MRAVTLISTALFSAKISSAEQFLWGVAGASYQVEGGWNLGGRQPSIWDTFSQQGGHTANNDTGDVADDVYHRYKDDIALAQSMGVNSYRMSISWSRVLSMDSDGTPESQARNEEGIQYYHSVIDTILAANMVPFVTIFHWDLPQSVYDVTNGGWISEEVVDYFHVYCDLLFSEYGDKVRHWLSFNEPLTFCLNGYDFGGHAPGRCSDRSKCPEGDSSTEPYLCSHNVLLSHADVAQLYHEKYASSQGGQIGMTLSGDWAEPMSNSQDDQDAAQRRMLWEIGWYADPMYFGDYPQEMKDLVGDRLPTFTTEQSEMLKGSSDFYGMNEYTGAWVANKVYNTDTPDWNTISKRTVQRRTITVR
jgi:beta-glucosidase